MGYFSFRKNIVGYAKQDRIGLLCLVALIGIILFVRQQDYFKESHKELINLNSVEVTRIQCYLDSLNKVQQIKTSQRFKFNPNYITDYNAYVWGINADQLAKLRAYRKSGNWINKALEFKQITGISDSLFIAINPYFRFPAWTQKSADKNISHTQYPKIKKALNKATVTDLQEVSGIGPTLSKRIIAFRERYGDFVDTVQLQFVYGLNIKTRKELIKHFEIKNPVPIHKQDFNTLSASDLATIPGISFDLATKMVVFRRLRAGIFKPEDLLKIDGMNTAKLAGIQLYLHFE